MSTENPQRQDTESSQNESRSQLDVALAKFVLFHDSNTSCYAKNKKQKTKNKKQKTKNKKQKTKNKKQKTGLIWRLDRAPFCDY